MRNVDSSFNKEGLIEHMVEVNIYYQEHKEKKEINVIREQKWSVIFGILWLAYHNPEINWRIGEVKIMRYLDLWKAVETKAERTSPAKAKGRTKERGRTKEMRRGRIKEGGRKKKKKRKPKKERTMEVKKIVDDWEI